MMFLKPLCVAVVSAAVTTTASEGSLGKQAESDLGGVLMKDNSNRDRHERQLITGDGFEGCVELRGGKALDGSRLVLGDCSHHDWGFDWVELDTVARTGKLVSRKNSTMCIQADTPLKEKNYVRLRMCRQNRRSQLFDWDAGVAPIDNKSLCLSYHGQHPDIGDFIKLKKCSDAEGGWSWD
jgi:hypothetical protein